MTLLEQLERWDTFVKLKRKVSGMLAKAIVQSIKDSTDLQVMKLSIGGESHRDVERVQNYGFTSRPKKGSQAVVAFIGGNRDNPIVLACDDGRVRIKLDEGETAIYNDQGCEIICKKNGDVVVHSTKGKVIVEAATGIDLQGVPLVALAGVVTQLMPCAFTGGPHPMGSQSVKGSP